MRGGPRVDDCFKNSSLDTGRALLTIMEPPEKWVRHKSRWDVCTYGQNIQLVTEHLDPLPFSAGLQGIVKTAQ